MTRPVSIVIPSLDDRMLLDANLPVLLAELEDRALGDQVVVVDDTGEDVLAEHLAERFPDIRVLAREQNGGFAAAFLAGVKLARHDLVFSMNPDVRVRQGFLDPLVACLGEEDVFAVAPRVLLDGHEDRVESLTGLVLRNGLAEVVQPGLGGKAGVETFRPVSVAFAVGGTCLFRRAELLEQGGFDPLYTPFYWEDVDICWAAWSAGRRVLYQPASVVEHHHRGSIGGRIPSGVVRAAIERNRMLFLWKHLDDPELLIEHVAALYRSALDAWLAGMRDELVWLNLALDRVDEALAARAARKGVQLSFREIQELAALPRDANKRSG